MKKVLLLAVAGLFVLASCKKEYTCECNLTYTSGSSQVITLESAEKVSKSDAESWCEENNYTSSGATSTCELK